MILLSKLDAERFYGVHKERAFFNDLCDYMTSGPIIVQVLKGKNAVMKNQNHLLVAHDRGSVGFQGLFLSDCRCSELNSHLDK